MVKAVTLFEDILFIGSLYMPKLNIGVLVKLLICFAIPLCVLFMPIDSIPIDDLTLIQHRLLAIFLLAALLWVLEPVPRPCEREFPEGGELQEHAHHLQLQPPGTGSSPQM